jgi:hypothetical protein
MLARDKGVIVQVGSALAWRSIPLQSAYCAAKHAVEGFTESLRIELMHDKSHVKVSLVQLPAVNTPQFDWVKSRLPGRAQPVPPIFQPEVPARAIVWMAENPRRELYVAYPTVKAIFSERISPRLGDWYLSKTGFKSQQTQEPADPSRPNNLWKPVSGDHGAHGRFDSRAKSFSLELWMRMNFKALALSLVGAGVATFLAQKLRAKLAAPPLPRALRA